MPPGAKPEAADHRFVIAVPNMAIDFDRTATHAVYGLPIGSVCFGGHMSGLQDPDRVSATLSGRSCGQPGDLQALLADVAAAAASRDADRGQRVAAALLPYLGRPGLLDHEASCGSPDRYTRHLVHRGPDYTILSLVWMPGQMSPVHAHRTWCAFGLHQGHLVESFFRNEASDTAPAGCVQRCVGDVGHSGPGQDTAHRIANLCIRKAVSIHVYGARYDRIGDDVNQIWAA